MPDIKEIRSMMASYYKDAARLRNYYEEPTFMGILNVGRKELQHSRMLKWLFNDSSFDQKTPDSPIMHLMDIAIKRANDQNKIGINMAVSDELANCISGRRFSIIYSECKVEESLDGGKRFADLIIRCNISNKINNLDKINICIENKVLTREHDNQTEAYYDFYSKNEVANWLFLYLTPLPSVELDNYDSLDEIERCTSINFIQINYQDILEYILEPILINESKGTKKFFVIDDYIKTLRYPIMEENDNKQTIMAIGETETKLLNDFWEGNHDLIELALMAMKNNGNLAEEIRENADNIISNLDNMEKAKANASDNTAYEYDGKNCTKIDLVLEMVKKLLKVYAFSAEKLSEAFRAHLKQLNYSEDVFKNYSIGERVYLESIFNTNKTGLFHRNDLVFDKTQIIEKLIYFSNELRSDKIVDDTADPQKIIECMRGLASDYDAYHDQGLPNKSIVTHYRKYFYHINNKIYFVNNQWGIGNIDFVIHFYNSVKQQNKKFLEELPEVKITPGTTPIK